MTEKTILFVDDERQILTVLKSIFENQYTVFTASNGPDALAIIHKQSIDIIVSDQRMPEMQGVDLLTQVKEVSPNTLGILLGSYVDMDVFMDAINTSDIFRFIEKPWNKERLKKTIMAAEKKIVAGIDQITFRNLGVLVFSDDRKVYATIHQLFGHKLNVYYANNLDDALIILEQQNELAVIITDIMVRDLINFFEMLKTTYPSLVSVVLSTKTDAHIIVRLINEGHIFRYLPKPVEKKLLEFNINGALKHYAELMQDPSLLEKEEELEEMPIVSASKKTTFMQKLKALLQGNS